MQSILVFIALSTVTFARHFADLECRLLSINGSQNNQVECTSDSMDKVYESNRSLWLVLAFVTALAASAVVLLASLVCLFVSRYGNTKVTIDWSSATSILESFAGKFATRENVEDSTKLVLEQLASKKDLSEVLSANNANARLINANVVEVYRYVKVVTEYFNLMENERPDKGPNRIQQIIQIMAQNQAAAEQQRAVAQPGQQTGTPQQPRAVAQPGTQQQSQQQQPQQPGQPRKPQIVEENNIALETPAKGEGDKVKAEKAPTPEEIAAIMAQYVTPKKSATASATASTTASTSAVNNEVKNDVQSVD